MILLDTNVLSELMRPTPDPGVAAWIAGHPASGLATTTITQAEIRHGIARLPSGRRRDALQRAVAAMFDEEFGDRVLPFDAAAAPHYATLRATRERAGRPIPAFDAQIAAIARAHRATIATRDLGGFADCGVPLVDPWAA
ncbi:MAG: type II toxin-antitoxin system VapC family toxin [Burkholderiaceae bacterium]|jgi:predicted nucleic acid-binding protein|nr:type II toxin-antitoxin system VapC family toxin [Burkholderiales bacterium]MCZ8107337.1 type II toxin-antitoxin system VapC family toxin [Burkholderiales bacterium]MCZ8339702.1 type II toxin-antitoxin system VapC family toxin [Burkholderiaceae bacterium]